MVPADQPKRTKRASAGTAVKATRRPRGAPRRLLLDAARVLFARKDYRSTTTREIAELAGVAEHLLFRQFGSKAALFREAVVVPFTDLVASFAERWESIAPGADEEEVSRQFLGALYDLFMENRGLVITLWSADAFDDEELAETGIRDIGRAIAVLGQIGAEGIDIKGIRSGHHELAARSTVGMVLGMAALDPSFFEGPQPSHDAIVNELTQATLHGFLHRGS